MKFTDEQLVILDLVNPFIDIEPTESRKGMEQGYPVMHVNDSDTYWCEESNEMRRVPAELVGDFILVIERGDLYLKWDTVRDYDGWQKAEYKQVKVFKWAVAE